MRCCRTCAIGSRTPRAAPCPGPGDARSRTWRRSSPPPRCPCSRRRGSCCRRCDVPPTRRDRRRRVLAATVGVVDQAPARAAGCQASCPELPAAAPAAGDRPWPSRRRGKKPPTSASRRVLGKSKDSQSWTSSPRSCGALPLPSGRGPALPHPRGPRRAHTSASRSAAPLGSDGSRRGASPADRRSGRPGPRSRRGGRGPHRAKSR
jgi:hypothetical protein